jgi:hypothetical protein
MKSSRFALVVLLWSAVGAAGDTSMALAQSAGTFTATGNMTMPRQAHTATLLTNGKVLITGGFAIISGWPVWASAELYDPSMGTFTATGNITTARYAHTATLLPNGKVLIAGGASNVNVGSGNSALASAELLDPSTGTFAATHDMTTARQSHTATLLNNGKVLIAGGTPNGNSPLASAELYDPSTGIFAAAVDMTKARAYHTATLLNNGKVLIDGGSVQGDDSAELYDPDTGTFSLMSGTAYPDLFPVTASLLTNGKVLVTLEYSCDPGDQAEVYDPSTGTFTATGNMTADRGPSTATLLPDGEVLIAARDYVYNRGHSAELFDPATGTFSATGGLVTEREAHTATLLPDGTVLMSGGWVCCGYSIATAEIYHPAVLVPAPALFSLSGGGRGQGAIWHSVTGLVASSSNPAVAGEVLAMYATGLADGGVVPPQVAVGGRLAEILFFGYAPIFGDNDFQDCGPCLKQVNFRVPDGVALGSAVPVRLTYLGRPSNEVTIGVQ